MKLRISEITEWQLLKIFEGSYFLIPEEKKEEWEIGNGILLTVNNRVAGVVEITGFPPSERNGVIALEMSFLQIISPEHRPSLIGKMRDSIVSEWGINYDEKIKHWESLSESVSDCILQELSNHENSYSYYFSNLDLLIEQEEEQEKRREEQSYYDHEDFLYDPDCSEHFKAQYLIKRIAQITDCSPWIATNDKNLVYDQRRLGDGCLEQFPEYEIDLEVKKGIALIDAVWFRNGFPTHAFEVECTTTVYSGILRMADLISTIPSITTKLYIVAPREREEKVMKEIRRPMFQKIGLSEYCKFIALEDLLELYEKVKGLDGYVKPDVVETIAIFEKQYAY